MSTQLSQAEIDEARKFDELQEHAENFLQEAMDWQERSCGSKVFSFDDSPSAAERLLDNFSDRGAVCEARAGAETLLKFNVSLWATVDWSEGTAGPQVAKQLRRMAEFLSATADQAEAKWPENQAWLEQCRRVREQQRSPEINS
jgi:hypothetical protein